MKPGYYATIVQLQTDLHCTDAQAAGSIVTTAQNLFGLPWKTFNANSNIIDLDTAPCSSNSRRETRVQELFSLASIVDKIMNSDDKSTISYHDDGSRSQGNNPMFKIGEDRRHQPLKNYSPRRNYLIPSWTKMTMVPRARNLRLLALF